EAPPAAPVAGAGGGWGDGGLGEESPAPCPNAGLATKLPRATRRPNPPRWMRFIATTPPARLENDRRGRRPMARVGWRGLEGTDETRRVATLFCPYNRQPGSDELSQFSGIRGIATLGAYSPVRSTPSP